MRQSNLCFRGFVPDLRWVLYWPDYYLIELKSFVRVNQGIVVKGAIYIGKEELRGWWKLGNGII